jgi:FG-GAP-like repeat
MKAQHPGGAARPHVAAFASSARRVLAGRHVSRPGRLTVARGRAIGGRFALTMMVVLVASLAAGSAAIGATTAPTFARADYELFGNNYDVGDFNGDGSLDLAGAGGPAAKVRLNNGAGAFGALAEYPVGGGNSQDLAAGDFNGDGRVDLVLTINDPQIGVSLLRGNGDGTFAAPVTFPNTSGFDSPAVDAVDLNNDGKLDVVIAHEIACYTAPCVTTDLISVMIGNGDGTFQPSREIPVGRGMSEIAVGDYNRDGFKDLAIAGTQGQVYRMYGVGDGTFVQQPTLIAVVDQSFIPVTDIDVADFNGDSIQDLVAAVPHNGSRTAILIGNADGTFRPSVVLTSPTLNQPQQQAVADYNGDGFHDLALSLGDGNQGLMQIRNGNGDGTFQAPVTYLVPPPTSSLGGIFILSANLNGDAKPDIVLNIGGAFPSFAVLLNSTGQAPPPTPGAPTLLSPAQDATPAQPVSFDWTDVTAATAYRIQVDDSNNFAAPLAIDRVVSASQFTSSTPLNTGRRHWWRVRGINSAGTAGAWSSTRRFTPQAAALTLSSVTLNPTNVVGGNTAQGTAFLTGAAPAGGAVVTLSSSSSVATVPASVTVAAGASSASFSVTTASVSTSIGVTITGAYSGATQSATLTVTPPPPPPGPASLSVSPATVEGGNPVTGTVFLSTGAPAGGLVVSLSSSNTAAATVPATMMVHGGLSSGTFPVSTLAGPTTRTTTITASANGVSRTAQLTVTPSAAASLSTVAVSPASVIGGASSHGTVTLTSPAPTGGFAVSLSSSNAAASFPAGVSIAQGTTSATFAITTSAVTASTPVTITASAAGVTRTATLTVNPQPQTATLTVTATGRGGERVTSNPAGINVAVGSSGSASFATGTTITLSATNSRDVIWSGACSSGGNKTKTCTFTLTGNAAITANVQ